MAPIEQFPSEKFADSYFGVDQGKYDWVVMSEAVKEVCITRGMQDFREFSVDGEHYLIGISGSKENGYAVVLIGHDKSQSDDLKDNDRPHTLIAPQGIIDGVKSRLEAKKEAAKFSTASSQL